jgi:hypothetical protein
VANQSGFIPRPIKYKLGKRKMEIGIKSTEKATEYTKPNGSNSVSKSTLGYMVVIGDQLRNDGAVFIEWVPAGGVGEMLKRVQFGSPLNMVILNFFAATPADVAEHQRALKPYACRTDATNWFNRLPQINDYIQRLRKVPLEAAEDTIDCEIVARPSKPVGKAKKPIQRPYKNKRRAKPRWL